MPSRFPCRFLVLVGFLGLLLSSTLAVESEFERNLTIALNIAKQKLDSNGSTPSLTATCYKKFGTTFGCPLYSHSAGRPTSVHELTPYDIDYVAALGDSITAAMGAAACTIVDDLFSFRGQSWSIGGNKGLSKVTTLPNIIRQYNPNVKGFSLKTGGPNSKNAKYNLAVIGAIAQDMPEQAKRLVSDMKSELGDEFNNAWKLVTLWIGGNNLCAYCNNKEKHSTANYVDSIAEALDILRDELPRTFVNLVQIIDVTRLEPLHGLVCDLVHNAVCKCGSEKDKLDETSRQSALYQESLIELMATDRYDGKDDFTVVLQPFFEGVELPYKPNGKDPDTSYFAPDCFHFSTKGHAEGAKALWKNMMEPVGSKTSGWELGGPLYCPTEEHKYFYTKKNSPPPSLYGQGVPGGDTTQDSSTSGHFSAVITSSTIGVAIMVVAIVIGTVLVALRMKKRDKGREVERLPLVKDNYY